MSVESPLALLKQRRFLPLFTTQFLNAFNDSFFRTAMVMLVVYTIYSNPEEEAQFSTVAQALFILPFFVLSAVSGQLADAKDKAWLIRIIKTAEIGIMLVGAAGLLLHNVPLMLAALLAMGTHSTFFGPIKYAILPQHLDKDHVLAGTGMVEAGTYVSILLGTIVGGILPSNAAAVCVILVALVGRFSASFVPPALPDPDAPVAKIDWNIFRASWTLTRDIMGVKRVRLAIICISFFWAIGALLAAQFPPLVKNALGADESVATLFLSVFSIGVAIGSIVVNQMLGGKVSARHSPVAANVMGLFVLLLWWAVEHASPEPGHMVGIAEFLASPIAEVSLFALFGIAVFGGMYVVPLYAFLTVTVARNQTARAIAVNNIINSGFMVAAAGLLSGLIAMGISIERTLILVAGACLVSGGIAILLHRESEKIDQESTFSTHSG
jgi:MFS family permease